MREPSRDGFGRQITHTPSSGTHAGKAQTLIWNAAHQLQEVKDAQTGQTIARYIYDASGNRISKTVSQTSNNNKTSERTEHYIYDNQHRLIAQADQTGQIKRQYLYTDHRAHSLIETSSSKTNSAQLLAVHTDWRGLPQKVLDEDQQVLWQQSFDVWGHATSSSNQPAAIINNAQGAMKSEVNKNPSVQTAAFDMPLRLAGQQYDAETGLHYNIHRYYDPAHSQGGGRYLSADPLGTPDGADRYAYVRGQPNVGIDPLGLFKVPALGFIGYDYTIPASDKGHGDIVRAAFAQYNAANTSRFSQTIIDQIIRNNYLTDAATSVLGGNGGQFNTNNHFDNPNDGPMYTTKPDLDSSNLFNLRTDSYKDAKKDNKGRDSDFWIVNSVTQIHTNRDQYSSVSGSNISTILGSFGQNSLVDVNYPDRSATTILAGGSGE